MAFAINSIPICEEIVIGPTLDELIQQQGVMSPELSLRIKRTFVDVYDDSLCVTATLYQGVEVLLSKLYDLECWLTLVTNKRIRPTSEYWSIIISTVFFSEVVGSDTFNVGKGESLKRVRSDVGSDFYVGDTQADCAAAMQADYRFLFASWGYGECDSAEILDAPIAILTFNEK